MQYRGVQITKNKEASQFLVRMPNGEIRTARTERGAKAMITRLQPKKRPFMRRKTDKEFTALLIELKDEVGGSMRDKVVSMLNKLS